MKLQDYRCNRVGSLRTNDIHWRSSIEITKKCDRRPKCSFSDFNRKIDQNQHSLFIHEMVAVCDVALWVSLGAAVCRFFHFYGF